MYNQGDFMYNCITMVILCLTTVICKVILCLTRWLYITFRLFSATLGNPTNPVAPVSVHPLHPPWDVATSSGPPMDQQTTKQHQGIGQKTLGTQETINPKHWFSNYHHQDAKATKISHRHFLTNPESHQLFNPWKAFYWDTHPVLVASEG